jgi:predicted benzoate:H+ symporter BenE
MDSIRAAAIKMLTVQNLLGAAILIAWLAMKFFHYDSDPSLDNVIMIVVGFIFGSSDGSKMKDRPAAPPPAA